MSDSEATLAIIFFKNEIEEHPIASDMKSWLKCWNIKSSRLRSNLDSWNDEMILIANEVCEEL